MPEPPADIPQDPPPTHGHEQGAFDNRDTSSAPSLTESEDDPVLKEQYRELLKRSVKLEGIIMQAHDYDFNLMLAQRILYQICQQHLFTPIGRTLEEQDASIQKAEEIAATMITNGDRP
jgi:hypothetical protein